MWNFFDLVLITIGFLNNIVFKLLVWYEYVSSDDLGSLEVFLILRVLRILRLVRSGCSNNKRFLNLSDTSRGVCNSMEKCNYKKMDSPMTNVPVVQFLVEVTFL